MKYKVKYRRVRYLLWGESWIFAKISLAPSRLLSSCSLKWSSLGPLTFQPIRKLFSAIDTFSFPFHFSSSLTRLWSGRLSLHREKKFSPPFLFPFFPREEMLNALARCMAARLAVIMWFLLFLYIYIYISFVPVKNNSMYLLFKFWPRFFPRAASRARQLWISNMTDRAIDRLLEEQELKEFNFCVHLCFVAFLMLLKNHLRRFDSDKCNIIVM